MAPSDRSRASGRSLATATAARRARSVLASRIVTSTMLSPAIAAAAALAGVTGLAALAHAAAPQISADQPITLDAESSDFDYRNSTLEFRSVRVSQGPLAVEAEQATATGLDFADSRWVFRGNVRITTADGSLQSDEARVNFARNEIASALVTGRPARFEQKREQGVARGRANRIEYDFGAGTVRLADGAWLSDGPNEITGRTLVYSMRDQRVLATAAEQGDERVRITITPRQTPPATTPVPPGGTAAEPPPAPAPAPRS